jgi:hypothetical protein
MAPLGLLLSLIGLVVDKNKMPAIIGLILVGVIAALFFLLVLC